MTTISRLICLCAVLATAVVAHAADQEYERFFGVYDGEAISKTDETLRKRDLKVTIEGTPSGFNLTWMLVTHKEGGRVKRQEYSIDFEPTRREGIYRSAMRQNVFGQQIPMDPLNGDPYVWGRIDGESLIVYGMIILDDGGYEMQQWVRTLTDEGMKIEFSRVRNGEILKTVEGALKRH